MEVILLERVEKLGQMGQVVRVKDGFARNYLLPLKKALRATDENRARFEKQRAGLEKTNASLRAGAEKSAGALDKKTCVLLRQASEAGQLYGSVTARDIAEAASTLGVAVDRRQVQLDRAIKNLGAHTVRIFLHPEVPTTVQVIVARSDAEAEVEKQRLAGVDVAAAGGQVDAAVAAQFFEDGAAPVAGAGASETAGAGETPKAKKKKARADADSQE